MSPFGFCVSVPGSVPCKVSLDLLDEPALWLCLQSVFWA